MRKPGKLVPLTMIACCSALALGVAGCGTVRAGGDQAAAAPARDLPASGLPASGLPAKGLPVRGAPPIDAALVTPAFGWVLTADRLLVTHDGGATFADVQTPLPGGQGRAAYFSDADNGYVTAAAGTAVVVARTGDGGATWQTTSIPVPAPAGAGALQITFGDAAHGAILAQTPTGTAFSRGTLFATTDGGSSWSARPAPAAGRIAVQPDGRTWLAGDGPAAQELHVSSDQGRHWTRARLDLTDAGESDTVAPPVGDTVPVTVVTKADQTQVALLTTADDGRTWRETNRVTVRGRTGPGVRVPVAAAATGAAAQGARPGAGTEPLVVDTAGGHAYRVAAPRTAAPTTTDATAADIHPAGLPEGVHTVTFAPDGRAGWALATYGTCRNGKHDCALYRPLLATADGGATWTRLALWQEKLD